ncbi:hypothetical protein ASC59_01275 [Leifsonia sp. Root1293]|nr:hypothetical protein ASC59_01275 [Leifsonia sp. Root1293]KRA12638.1 hypothetical protein ASD61_01275 [Leifsonia sp. Root60]
MLADAITTIVAALAATRRGVSVSWRAVASTMTVFGWSVVIAVFVGFVGGHLLGWAEFIALAWAGTVLLALSAFYLVGRNSFRIDLALPVHRVVVGEKAPGEVVVSNPTRRHLAGVGVEVPIGDGLAEFHIPGIPRGSNASEIFLVAAERRGVIPVGPVRTIRGDPLGLFRRELTWAERTELYVHPRTIPIPAISTGFVRDLEGAATRTITSSDVSFHALREYTAGDDRRLIHWRSSAKTGVYMVRQFEETRRSHIMVVLGLAESDFADDEEFELAVSAAGSLGVHAIRDARSVSVIASGERAVVSARSDPASFSLRTTSRIRLLDDLTLVQRSPGATGIVALTRMAGERAADASVAFIITGSATTVAQLRHAAAGLPPGVEVVAVICEPGALPVMRRVADLTVLRIGYLDDLQQSLARAAVQ